ncbi:MAG: hypothetical protein ABI559_03340 [Chloroflexota bacterium]
MNTPIRLVGAVVLVVAAAALFRFVLFPSSAKLSAEQITTLQSLEPRLPELLVVQPDAAALFADAADCHANPKFAPPAPVPNSGPHADSEWCSASGAFITTDVSLPMDWDSAAATLSAEVALHVAAPDRAIELAKTPPAGLVPITGSVRFTDADGIGPYSHILRFRANYPNNVQIFDYYDIHFVENWISVQITIVLPGNDVNNGAAATIAQAVYNRITQVLAQQSIPTLTP